MGFAVYLLLALLAVFALLLLRRAGCLESRAAWLVSVLLLLLAFSARAYVLLLYTYGEVTLPASLFL